MKPDYRTPFKLMVISLLLTLLAGCNDTGSTGQGVPESPNTYRIKGTVSGLNGTLSLTLNDTETLNNRGNGTFEFTTELTDNSEYHVTHFGVPDDQLCDISNGTGIIDGNNITDVQVTCFPRDEAHVISGTITGLNTNGLQLSLNAKPPVDIAGGATAFNFNETPLHNGTAYQVAITQNPEQQLCTVAANGNGTVEGTDIDTLQIHCRAWQTEPEQITDNHRAAQDTSPGIALNNDGDAALVWLPNRYVDGDGKPNIWAKDYYAEKGGWQDAAASRLQESLNRNAADAQVALNDVGDAIVVWFKNATSWAHVRPSQAAWNDTAAHPLENSHNRPQIALNNNRLALAVFEYYGSRARVSYSHYDWGSKSWSAGTPISHAMDSYGGYRSAPQLALNDNNLAIAVWRELEQGQGETSAAARIWASTFTQEGNWSEPTLLDEQRIDDFNDHKNTGHPQIALNEAGQAVAVWETPSSSAAGDSKTDIRAITFADGEWDSEAVLLETTEGHADLPDIAIDERGRAVAVWQQNEDDTNRRHIWVNQYDPDSLNWKGVVRLDTTEGVENQDVSQPQIALTPGGDAIAVWEQVNQSDGDNIVAIWASVHALGVGDWRNATPKELHYIDKSQSNQSSRGSKNPQLDSNQAGTVIVVWEAATQSSTLHTWSTWFK
ncbi:hypothetical protein BGP77_14995 [Saccharospirillum sp. MSK14-1]|uniref:hypothetical protein n=1 Tax=Saccharospirillum sp. MSK14-1 TaxID=1897632 RepID=UPI000D363D1A|nr:hypothetical protein [Saccharospirillum sp. MSK14-1]PTY37783.1 hypothetical protein BGP77_14995 [Saccharospirillum sp. MSK14-1]